MVASSANTRRPRLPAAKGDIALAFSTKAAMSSVVERLASGSDRPVCRADAASAAVCLVGSRDKRPSLLDEQRLIWADLSENASAAVRRSPQRLLCAADIIG